MGHRSAARPAFARELRPGRRSLRRRRLIALVPFQRFVPTQGLHRGTDRQTRNLGELVRQVGTALALLIVVVSLAPVGVDGQAPTAAANIADQAPSRTPWGDPDLQGIWDFRTITPLERPSEFVGKEVLTEEEAAQLEKRAVATNTDEERPTDPERDVSGAYNDFWWDRGDKVVPTRRTSLIVDPPDGRIPSLTPEGQQRADARAEARRRPAASWEDRSLFERCVTRGLPRLPGGYNQNLQILQTPESVVILYEMMREVRVIPLDRRPHVAPHIRQWMGDSRGHWEGKTLVVDTTNFTHKHDFRGSAGSLHLVERFTRVDAATLVYEFTADDRTTWTKPWTAEIPMRRTEGPIFEYACHEGNYGMFGILSGARAEETARPR